MVWWIRNGMQKIGKKLSDESGMGVVEVVLIIVVLIGLVIIFQNNIRGVVSSIFATIQSHVGQIQ